MIDLNQFLTVGGLSVLLMLVLTVVKPVFRDPRIVPFVAVGSAIVLALLAGWGTGHLSSAHDLVTCIVLGIVVGAGSSAAHELTFDKLFPPPKPPIFPAE